MISGMTVAKITVSLPQELVDAARRAVDADRAASVSAYVADAIREKASREDLRLMLDEMFDETGGPPTSEERAWARRVLRR